MSDHGVLHTCVTSWFACIIDLAVEDLGPDGCTSANPCSKCQGDCDYDNQCSGPMLCFQRESSSATVPGCAASGYQSSTSEHDYCYDPNDVHHGECYCHIVCICNHMGVVSHEAIPQVMHKGPLLVITEWEALMSKSDRMSAL